MIKIVLANSSGVPIDVSGDNCLSVVDCGAPPLGAQKTMVFSQKLTTTGLTSGSDDMGIDGSVAPVDFHIPASEDDDRYITRLSFIIGYGSSSDLFVFADAAAALTNGVRVYYINSYSDGVTIMNPKANYSFMRASGIPVTNTNWETRGFAAAGDYGFFINIDLSQIMPPYGIKLDKGTKQKLCVTIRDNCSDADLFNCQAFGFERLG